MHSNLLFLNVLSRVLSSKITLAINFLLVLNYVLVITKGEDAFASAKILLIILAVYNIFNVLVSYACSKFYVKIHGDILEYNTYGLKGSMDLNEADYTIISEDKEILQNRLAGISINGLNFGKYSLKDNCGTTSVYSTKNKGIAVVISTDKSRLFIRTNKINEIIKIMEKLGKKPVNLSAKREDVEKLGKNAAIHIAISSGLIVLTIVALYVFQNSLPDPIPVHWNSLGIVNSYWTKKQLIFLFPTTILFFNLLFCIYCAKQKLNKTYALYIITAMYYITLGSILYMQCLR